MGDEKDNKPGTQVATETATDDAVSAARRRPGAVLWFLVLVLVAGLGFAFWWFALRTQAEPAHDYAGDIQAINQKLDAIQQQLAHLKDRDNTLHARLDDGEQVDQSVRAQLLALNQRAQTLEESVGKLAAERMSGHDSLALDRAELLLTLGSERFNLYHDIPATIAAYRAADAALEQIRDSAFAPVRESIQAEIDALKQLHASDPVPLIAALDSLRSTITELPAPKPQSEAPANVQKTSRLWRILGAMVLVRHEEKPKAKLQLRDVALSRNLVILDLRDAEAAALARNASRYNSALKAARAQIDTAFDPQSSAVKRALQQLDELDSAKLEPEPPSLLGTSLKQLRALRATHTLRASTPKPPAANPAAPQS